MFQEGVFWPLTMVVPIPGCPNDNCGYGIQFATLEACGNSALPIALPLFNFVPQKQQ
jgi:hypothetical protein